MARVYDQRKILPRKNRPSYVSDGDEIYVEGYGPAKYHRNSAGDHAIIGERMFRIKLKARAAGGFPYWWVPAR